MNRRSAFRWLESGLLGLGLLLLALWSTTTLEARGFHRTESAKLEAATAAAEPGRVPATPTCPLETGDVLGRIEIPRLHIEAIVAEGSDAKTLRVAVGHIPSTARPGSPGNCALAGHRDTFLRHLGDVRRNDLVLVVTAEHTYSYQVEWSAIVEPQRVEVLDSTATRSLTLVTCYPFVFAGHAPRRFVVRARQVETGEAFTTANVRIKLQRQGMVAGDEDDTHSEEGVH